MLRIYNQNRQCDLVVRGQAATNFWTRGKGLIGSPPLGEGEGLLIQPCNSVHCFFMSFPIDVLYVDKEFRVVDMDHTMRPWQMGKIRWKSHAVIELPAGTLQRTGTAVGDQLVVEE